MQNLQLPTLNANTAATPAAAAKPARSNNDSFQRSLAREMDARQASRNQEATRAQERQAANRNASANTPKPAEKVRPAPQAERATESSAPPRRDAASASANASQDAQAGGPASNEASQADEAARDGEQAEARSGDAVADMLALVAALNQPAGAADGTAGTTTETAAADAVLAGSGKSGAAALGNAVDAATLASLTQAEAQAADNTGVADVQAMSARLNAADFKAALGRAAAAALPAQNAADAAAATAQTLAGDGAGLTEGILPTTGKPDSTGTAHGKQSAAGAAASAAAAPAEGRSKTDDLTGGLSLRELATQPRQQESNALRTRAEAEALQASKDAAATAATDAGAPAATAPAAALDASRAAGVMPSDKLYSRVGTPAWDQQLGQKVIFMSAGGDQSATLELNPPDLGPLQVVLSVSKDQATAAFTSAAPEVREALENALPRLREMMGEAGIQLGNATVSAGNPGQQDGQLAGGQHGAGNARGVRGLAGSDGSDSAEAAPRTVTVRRLADGAVDTFA